MLADRFSTSPFVFMDAPADDLARLLALLAIEGKVSRAYEGLGPDDEFIGDLAEDED